MLFVVVAWNELFRDGFSQANSSLGGRDIPLSLKGSVRGEHTLAAARDYQLSLSPVNQPPIQA